MMEAVVLILAFLYFGASLASPVFQKTEKLSIPNPLPCLISREHADARKIIRHDPCHKLFLLPECSSCTNSSHCSTRKCWNNKCVYDTEISKKKCFSQKSECSLCTLGSECSLGKCWGSPRKCTDGSLTSLLKCGYRKECEACTSGLQCSTMKCLGGKCVFDTQASKDKCFHSPLKPECSPCSKNSDCAQGKCWGTPQKCTDGSYSSLLKCGFKPECSACTSALQCATKFCLFGKCLSDISSRNRCHISLPPIDCRLTVLKPFC